MKPVTYVCACVLAMMCLGSSADADPKADADYIASQVATQAIFEGAISAQKPLITSAIQNNLRVQGITLTDPDAFFDLFMEEFLGEFTQSMQAQTASIYLNSFSDEDLANIAAFFKTDSGQAYLLAVPGLMMEGARMGTAAGQIAGANAGKRLAARIQAEGLVVVEDPSLLSRLLEALK